MYKKYVLLTALIFGALLAPDFLFAQLSGIKNIPGDYADIASAFAALNNATTGGVCSSGSCNGVIFNVAAGSVFSQAPLTLNITVNKPIAGYGIVFRKWGTGADPVINITGTSGNDAGIMLVGTDYITFDGLKINDAARGTGNNVENGIMLARASATDGCQHDTIRNCTIDLDNNNNGGLIGGSCGIFQSDHNSSYAGLDPTAPSGIHENNSYYNNTITDVVVGFLFWGGNLYTDVTTSNLIDINNDVGVKGGNNITCGGGAGNFEVDGVYILEQQNLIVANNTIQTAAGNVAPYTEGIYDFISTNNTESFYNNDISVSSDATSSFGDIIGIAPDNEGLITNIYNNIIHDCKTASGALAMYGTFNLIDVTYGLPATLNIYNNIFRNNQEHCTNNNNSLNCFYSFNSSSSVINMYGNQIYNNTSTTLFIGFNLYGAGNYFISSNQIYSNSANSSIEAVSIGGNWGISANSYNIYNNSIHDLTSSTSQAAGIQGGASQPAGQTNNVYGNSIYNITGAGQSVGISLSSGSATFNIYKNNIHSISGTSSAIGLSMLSNSTTGNLYNNFISDIQAPNGFSITGLFFSGAKLNLYHNSIYLNQTSSIATGFNSTGIYINSSSTMDVRNNLVVNTSNPGATATIGIVAIQIDGAAGFASYLSTSDYNSYYAGTPGAKNLIFYNATIPASDQTLAAFQTRVSTRDAHSITANPVFFSATDLHTNDVSIQGKGTYLASVPTDIDNQTRANPPCIGADETSTNPDMGVVSLVTPAFPACPSSATSITFRVQNFSSSTINFATNNVTITYSVTGINTTGQISGGTYLINSGTLASGSTMDVTVRASNYDMTSAGTYIFSAYSSVAGGVDANTSNDALSPTVTLTILAPISASASAYNVCSGIPVSLYASGASSYTWSPSTYLSSSTGSSITCTPTSPVVYTITGTYANGCTNTTTLSLYAFSAPLNGTYTIDNTLPSSATNFTSFTNAINTLNCLGISGSVIFNAASGESFYESNMTITATGTAANTITFQKSGLVHPIIYSSTWGTSTTLDGILKLQGTDYITFDGIDISESAGNINATQQMEWGYAVLKNTATDGAQNVTIKNCVITLNKANANSVGIYSNNHTPASTTGLTVTSTAGANSNNQFYSNTISNVYAGISIAGYNDPASPYNYYDQNNSVGLGGGNSISNYGGGTTSAYGIYADSQNGLIIANNTITAGTGTTGSLYGINTASGTNSNVDIYYNTITPASSATGPGTNVYGINNGMGTTGTTNNVNIYNNTVQNLNWTTATTGVFYGINNGADAYNVAIYNNTITNISKAGTGTFRCIYDFTTAGNVLKIYGNNIYGNTGTNSVMPDIGYFPATVKSLIHDNNIYNNTCPGGVHYIVWCSSGTGGSNACYSNNIHDITMGSGGTLYGIMYQGASTSDSIYGNSIYNLNNAGAGAVAGIVLNSGVPHTTFQNTIRSLSSAGGAVSGIILSSGTAVDIYKNKIYTLSSSTNSGTVYGMQINSGNTVNVSNNMVSDLKCPAANTANAINGLYLNGGTTVNAYYNSIYINTSSSSSPFGTSGIFTNTTSTIKLINNVVVNTSTPAGIGLTVAHYRNSSSLANFSNTSGNNNNCYYTSATPDASHLIYYDGTNSYQTIAAYITATGTREDNSITANPAFTSATDLHLPTSDLSLANLGATIIGYPDDIDSQTRACPDIGADEYLDCSDFPLPIELLFFDAKRDGDALRVRCDWSTATETNSNYFAIERSQDANTFERIGTLQGAGNSSTTNYYSFYDQFPYSGWSYYRLKQVDYDGKYSYSSIATVYIGYLNIVALYPNPAIDNVTISISTEQNTEAITQVYNVLGQIVYKRTIELQKGKTEIRIPVGEFANGQYLFKVTLPSGEHTQKVFMK